MRISDWSSDVCSSDLTWRAVFPFFALMYPERDSQFMQGLVNTYKQGGWLPEWTSPGYRNVMIGSNSANLIADAYFNGVRGFDVEPLYEAMIKNATTSEDRPKDKAGKVIAAVGREGAEYYNRQIGRASCRERVCTSV